MKLTKSLLSLCIAIAILFSQIAIPTIGQIGENSAMPLGDIKETNTGDTE